MALYTDYVNSNFITVSNTLIDDCIENMANYYKRVNYFGLGAIYNVSYAKNIRVLYTTPTGSFSTTKITYYIGIHDDGVAQVDGQYRVFSDGFSTGDRYTQYSSPDSAISTDIRIYAPFGSVNDLIQAQLSTSQLNKFNSSYEYVLKYDDNGFYLSYTGNRGSAFSSTSVGLWGTMETGKIQNAGYYTYTNGKYSINLSMAAGIPVATKTQYGSVTNTFIGIDRSTGNDVGNEIASESSTALNMATHIFLLFDSQQRFSRHVFYTTDTLDGTRITNFEDVYSSGFCGMFWVADTDAWTNFYDSVGLPWSRNLNDILDIAGTNLNYPTTGGVSDLPGYETDTTTPGTGDNSSSQVVYPGVTFDPASGGYGRYWLTGTQMTDLHNFLYSETFINNFKRVFSDPIDSLINITSYPFTYNTAYTTAANVTMGGVESDIAAYKMSNSSIAPRIDFGYCAVQRYYNSYLDYAPYTAVSIYLPYIGIRPLQVSAVMNDIVYCEYVIDLNNQMVTAYISVEKSSREAASNVPIASYTGNIGVNLPMAGVSNTEKIATVLNTAISLTQGAISVAGGVSNVKSAAGNGAIQGAAGGAAGMIAGGIAGGLQAIPQAASAAIGYVGDVGNALLGGQQVEPQMVGQFSPNGAIYAPQQPYLIISRPVTLSTNMLSYYSDLNGRSASYYGAVSEFTKYLQISEMDLVVSSKMTIQEQNEIISLMKSGVYVTE